VLPHDAGRAGGRTELQILEVSVIVRTDDGAPFADDMVLMTDLDLIAELADQAAQGALMTYGPEDWQRSPVGRTLEVVVARLRSAGRTPSSSVTEAWARAQAARRLSARVVRDDLVLQLRSS
jgi:hypothetical protein